MTQQNQPSIETGTDNQMYDLIRVLYHALEGAKTYSLYAEDARKVGANDLAEFFDEVHQQEHQQVDRAKALLAKYVR